MAALLIAMALVFVAIAGRLVSIQGISADHYLAVGLKQRLRTLSLPGQRGAIFDRTGQDLAVSVPATTIWADPHLVADPQSEGATLAPLLGVDSATLQSQLRSASRFVYLSRRMDNDKATQVANLHLPGVFTMSEPKRFLPAGTLALPLLGSVGSDNSGLSGLEADYNRQLTGQAGKLVEELDPQGSQIPGGYRQYQAPVNGQDLILTIDESLQAQTEQALAAQITASRAKSGTAAVMDTRTGELLAVASLNAAPDATSSSSGSAGAAGGASGSAGAACLASGPSGAGSAAAGPASGSTAPSAPAGPATSGSATSASATSGSASSGSSASAAPTCGAVAPASATAFTGVFEPGSISKLVTISAALEDGVVQPSDHFAVPDTLKVSDGVYTDAESHPVEDWTVTDILANSSNVGTITIAQRLGRQRLSAALAAFGFGQTTAVHFPGESAGLVPNPASWSGTSIGSIPIGQGVAVTAIQMLAAYNTIANGGVYVAPKLVAATVGADGRTEATPASAEHRVVSPQVAQEMTTMLGEVVRVGTGQLAKVDGYTVAGKTGTARIPLQNARGYMNGVYTSSFAGFVPAEHPSLTSIVVLDQTPLFGGVASAPLFGALAGYGLHDFRIAPAAPQPPTPGVPLATPQTAQAAGEILSSGGSSAAITSAGSAAAVAAAALAAKTPPPTTAPPTTAPGAKVPPTTVAPTAPRAPASTSTGQAPPTTAGAGRGAPAATTTTSPPATR